MNTEDHDYDDVRQKAALGLLGLSPTNIHPPSTPFGISGLPTASGSLSSSTPNRSPLVGSSTAPRRRTPIESQNTPNLSAGATSRTVVGLGRPVEDEGYSGQAPSPIIPLKRKHLSTTNEANSAQPPNSSSSQTQGRRRGTGSGGRGGGRGRGRGSANAGVNGRHTSDGQHSNSGTGSVSSTRFDPVAHARRTNDRDAARDIDSLSITTHTATPDRDQDMPGTGGNGQRDHDADANADSDVDPESAEAIRCICGFSNDDGWSIGCDGCGRWCHGVCFGIDEKDKENLPERWECWECNVNLVVDRERAVRLQRARLNLGSSGKSHSNGDGDADADKGNSRRRTSPGVERKPRKSSAGTGTVENGHKRRRRSSIMTSPVDRFHALPNSHHTDHLPHPANGIVPLAIATAVNGPSTNGVGEDTFVDIDEPWTHAYNDIAHDIVPHRETRDKLRRQAAQWRGVTAISPVTDSQVPDTPIDYFQQYPYNATGQQYPPANSPVVIHPLHPILNPNQSTPSNLPAHLLRPPTYALHTTSPIPCSSLITPFPSTITSSATYLADPLNAYAHLGMPKPYVHLIGPPLDVALDARVAGGKGRWARSGCRPNAVIRPVVCDISNLEKSKRKGKEDRDRKEKGKSHKAKNDGSNDADPQTLAFGIFALRDLKADEEIVLGWEWDDGNVVHMLPALLKEEGAFPPADLHNFRMQMSNILHALTSTYATCACGAHTQDCAIKRMAEFVERGERLEEEAAQREKELRERDLKDGDRRRRADKDEVIRLHSPWTPGAPPTPFSAMPTPRLPWDAFSGPARPSSAPQTSTPASASPSTFTLPHERHQSIAVSEGDKESTSRRDKGPVDLGPLIGAARGFKTRERIPGSGGLSGVEMVPRQDEAIAGPSSLRVNTELNISRPSSVPAVSNSMHMPHFLVSPASPSPNHGRHVILHGHEDARSANLGETSLPRLGYGIKKRSNIWGDCKGKGKGKAVEFEESEVEVNVVEDEDIDMNATDGSGGAHKGSTSHPRSRKPLSRNKNKEKDKSQSLSPISLSTSLHPPDPGTSRLESETLSLPIPEEKMPPKMRKRWIHKEAEALLAKDISKSVSKSSNIGNREKGTVEAKKKGKDRAITVSSGEAMDVDEESPRIRAGDGDSHSITADPPARTSPSTPFARLSLQSPAVPASSSSSHPVSTVSQSHSESFERDTHPPNSPAISSESPALSPPSRTSSSFLARVLNSPEHSWVPFRWEQSDKPEASANEIHRSIDEPSTGEDNTMDEAAISKEIKKEVLETIEHQGHSTDGEDVIMEGPEQDELLPTPSPPPSPSRTTEDDSQERAVTKTDFEARRSDSASSGSSTPRQSVSPVVEGDLPKLNEVGQAVSLPEEIISSTMEIQDQTDRPTSAGPKTNCSPALSTHQSALPSPAQQSMPLSSPLSSPVSSPFEPTVTMDVIVQPSDSVSVRQHGEGTDSTSSDVVPELVPSTSISPIQSVRDVPPATPPSVLSSLSPFSSPVSANGRDDDVKSSRDSPMQDVPLAVLDSKTVSPKSRSPLPDPEVTKDPAEFPGDVAVSPQEAPSTPAVPSSDANFETATEETSSTEPPPQPAPSKVKLSLKDFALRKRRMREEEEKERAEKAKAVPSAPVGEPPAQDTEAEHLVNTVNGEVDAVEQGKQDVLVEPTKEGTKSLTSVGKSKNSVEDLGMKVEEISVRSDPIIAPASTAVNGDAKGRPHSPSLAPLPMNISLSSLPALTLPPVVSNPATGSPTPDILNPSLSRKATQQEEGEIDDVPASSSALPPRANALPPKPPTPVLSKHKFADSSLPPNPALQHLPQNPTKSAIPPFRQTLKHGAESAETRSRTPPTQPRSFTGYGGQYTARSPHTHTSPIPTTPRVLASVTAPTAMNNTSNTASPIGATPLSAIGRPPPSGPRALRQQQQSVGTGRPIHSIPRGPSHERDRDGRDWSHRYRR